MHSFIALFSDKIEEIISFILCLITLDSWPIVWSIGSIGYEEEHVLGFFVME